MSADAGMITKLFFRLLPVQILLVAIGSVNSIIDGIFAGNLIGPAAIAVTGLFMPVIKMIETVDAVMLGGSQILSGQFLGKQQVERTRNVFSLDVLLIFLFSIGMTAVCAAFSGPIADFLRADEVTREGLIRYITGNCIGFLPMMVGSQLVAFLQMERQQRRTYFAIAAMALTNVLMDLLLIRVLGWGLFGLGLATSVSYWVFFLILAFAYFRKRTVIRFDLSGIRLADLGPILKIGIPGALVTFCLAVRGVLLNHLLMDCSGDAGVAALAALNNFGSLLFSISAGLAAATRLLASVFIGEEDRTSLVMVMQTALKKGVLLVCLFSAVVIALAVPFTMIFFKDPSSEVFYLTKWIFRIFPLSMPLSAICVIFINYYQSFSRMRIVNTLSVMDGVLGICIAGYALAPVYGAMGIWVAHVLNGVFTTIAIVIYAWHVNGRPPRSIEDLMTLPDDFGVPEDSRLDISIRNADDVTKTSIQVMEFCRGKGTDMRRTHFAGLCLEEMTANIVEHGFADGRRHALDVRVVYKDGELLLRIKDDCRPFDPKEQMELMDPQDVTKNIGLRMVQKMAKSMTYSNMLGLNVLTITL